MLRQVPREQLLQGTTQIPDTISLHKGDPMNTFVHRLTDEKSQEIASRVGEVFSSLPHLPKGIVEFLVKITPYVALLGAILSLLAGPLLGIASVISLITLSPFLVLSTAVAAVLAVITAVILFFAFKPLKDRKYEGWMLLFWSDMLHLAQTLLSIVLGHSSVFDLVGVAIGVYILYEMRSFYGYKGKIVTVKAVGKHTKKA